MAMYRVLHRLDVGKAGYLYPGTFSRMEWLDEKQCMVLEEKGAISRVRPPPLHILPGWEQRAKQLEAALCISDAEQLMEADVADLADAMGVDEDGARELRAEIVKWLTADEPAGG